MDTGDFETRKWRVCTDQHAPHTIPSNSPGRRSRTQLIDFSLKPPYISDAYRGSSAGSPLRNLTEKRGMPCQQFETTLSSGKLFLAITSQAAEAFSSGQPPLPAEQLFLFPSSSLKLSKQVSRT